jgi:hypothetical protein
MTGDWDFGGGGIEIENGTTPPACTVGQLFLDTDATAGQQLMACEGGTFVKQGDGGAGGGDEVSIDGVGVTNPNFTSTGDIDFVDTTNVVTANINDGATMTTPAADTNSTVLATTAFVQTEIQDAADDGRSVTGAATGVINADAELYTDTKCMTIETPATGDDFLWFRPDLPLTVTAIDCIVAAATSATVTLKECDSNGANCGSANSRVEESLACATTNTADDASIGNPGVPAGAWIRIDPTAVSGTPAHVTICMTFTMDE